ncbi:kinetochore-associated Ndc80 complex subunit nuf2 [Entophlyctis luteolus]|nr:kinetochore-associated Ndc80 complex subunit nuf2 [Entophlyctis luteolus]
MSQHTGYSFPILKPSDIVPCMADLHISVSAEDLERPTPAKMLSVFETCAEIFMGVSQESLPHFAALDIPEHPEIHQDDIALMGFYRLISKLIANIGIGDFSLRDLIKPEPARVRKILSGIINFAKFREERLSVFEQCTQKSAEFVEQKAFLIEKKQEVAERVNTMRLQRAEEEPAYQRVRERNLAFTAELRELKRIQTAMTSDIENLKKSKNETIEKLARIVPNPEKLQKALTDMQSSIASEKTSLAAREKQYRDLLSKLDAMTDIVACSKLMEECEFEMKKAAAASNKLATEQENSERKKQELQDANIKQQQFNRQLSNINEKHSRLKKQYSSKKEANDAKMRDLCSSYEATLKERDANNQKIEANNARILELDEKISAVRKKIDAENASFQESFSKLKTRGERYCAELAKAKAVLFKLRHDESLRDILGEKILIEANSMTKGHFNLFKGFVDCQFKVKGTVGEALVRIKGSRTAAKDVWHLSKLVVEPLGKPDREAIIYA